MKKPPPNNLDAEKTLLGTLILSSKGVENIADILLPKHFYNLAHGLIYTSILNLWQENQPVDILHILNKLETKDFLEKKKELQTIDKQFLIDLISYSSLTTLTRETALQIREKYYLREIIDVSNTLKDLAYDENSKATELLDRAQQKLFNAVLSINNQDFYQISELLGTTLERINQLHLGKNQDNFISTGFDNLDSILGGLYKGDLIILAARPSMGKSSLALEIAKRVSMGHNGKNKVGVAIYSLEMSKDQLVDKLLASASKVEAYRIRTGYLKEDNYSNDFQKLGEGISLLSEAEIYIDDIPSLSILELKSKTRKLKSKKNIGLVIVDYLQLMQRANDAKYQGNRVQEISEMTRGLKILAKELSVPVLVLSQLSRGVESRDDKRPMLSDLRESGSIEQDADVVMFVHREEMYNRQTLRKDIADIIVSKNRNGKTGTVELRWLHSLATFDDL